VLRLSIAITTAARWSVRPSSRATARPSSGRAEPRWPAWYAVMKAPTAYPWLDFCGDEARQVARGPLACAPGERQVGALHLHQGLCCLRRRRLAAPPASCPARPRARAGEGPGLSSRAGATAGLTGCTDLHAQPLGGWLRVGAERGRLPPASQAGGRAQRTCPSMRRAPARARARTLTRYTHGAARRATREGQCASRKKNTCHAACHVVCISCLGSAASAIMPRPQRQQRSCMEQAGSSTRCPGCYGGDAQALKELSCSGVQRSRRALKRVCLLRQHAQRARVIGLPSPSPQSPCL
jgi:hypothetical protein